VKSGQSLANAASAKTIQDARVRGIVVWFYIIAGLQLFTAYQSWQAGDDTIATVGATFAVFDLLIGVAFVVLAYFASKKHPWAFVAGLVLYVVRTVVNLMEFFNPIVLVVRLYLTFRMWQGVQACLAANRADQAMAMLNQRRLVMPTMSPTAASVSSEPAATPAQPWRPPTSDPASAEAPLVQPWRPAMPQNEPETP